MSSVYPRQEFTRTYLPDPCHTYLMLDFNHLFPNIQLQIHQKAFNYFE